MTFEFTSGDLDSDDDGEEDYYTAEGILPDKPDPATPGGRLYKVCSKEFSPFAGLVGAFEKFCGGIYHGVARLSQKKGISIDVKDVLVHLMMHKPD